MRTLFIVFAVCTILLLSFGISMLWVNDYGYVLVTNGLWRFELSLSQATIITCVFLFCFYIVMWSLLKVWQVRKLLGRYRQKRNAERARHNIIYGLIELTEGHWKKAEQMLLRNIENSDTPLLNYLLAARAAQQQDADDRRDEYLKRAHEITPKADVAIGLTQAELQMAHGQTEQALATLTRLRELTPKHPYVLKLLSRLYTQLNEWEKLASLLPEIRRHRILSIDKLLELERTAYTQLIQFIARSSAVFNLEEQWRLLPKRYREDPEIFRVYINCLLDNNKQVTAEKQLRTFLHKHWNERLVQLYALVESPQATKQLDFAEVWLKDHGRSPMLLLTLARLSYRLRLWGKARVYYESSLAIHPSVEAYAELAELLESLGETDSAHECFRKGLELATSDSRSRRSTDRPFANRGNEAQDKLPSAEEKSASSQSASTNKQNDGDSTNNKIIAIK